MIGPYRVLTFEQVMKLIKKERKHQDEKWGTIEQLVYFWRSGKCYPSTTYADKILHLAGDSLSLSDLLPKH